MAAPSSKYEYPRLSRQDIVAAAAELQIASLTEHDLVNPNPDLMAELYTCLLIRLDLLEEENEQLDFEALAQFDNPDYHYDSIRTMKLYNRIKEVLAVLVCPKDFTLADLLTPDSHRAEFFVGALLNFALHREARLGEMTGVGNKVDKLEEQRTKLEVTEISQVKLEISDLAKAKEMEMAVIQEVDAKVVELRNTIMVLNKNQMSLRTTLKKLKDKTDEMDAKISNAEFTLSQHAQENENLHSKIAQSPDKVQRALEDMKLAREEARKAERLAMQSSHGKTALLEVYSKVLKKMSKHHKQMQTIKDQVNSAKSVEKELKALKAKLSDEEVLEKSLEAKSVERQSKVVQMEELKKQLENECSSKREEATKYLNSKRSEVESKKHDMETRQRDVVSVLAEVDAMNSKIKSAKESGATKVELLSCKCEEIVEEFQKYTFSIQNVIESRPKTQVG